MTKAPGWTEVRVDAPSAWLELVAQALQLGPTTSVVFGCANGERLSEGWDCVLTHFPEHDDDPVTRAAIEQRVRDVAAASGAPELAGMIVSFRRVPDADFARAWRKDWRPLRVGSLHIVTPDWRGRPRVGETLLRLEPGGAFGTGRHATTRACLRALQGSLKPGERVLDAGCGNGVLAVASLLLGAASAFAFDNDPTALAYARELSERNGVAARCELRAGGFELLAGRDAEFDGVLANIYADLIREHARDLARTLRPGGWFVFSGCAVAHRPATTAALAQAGLTLERRVTRDGWDTFLGARAVERPGMPALTL